MMQYGIIMNHMDINCGLYGRWSFFPHHEFGNPLPMAELMTIPKKALAIHQALAQDGTGEGNPSFRLLPNKWPDRALALLCVAG